MADPRQQANLNTLLKWSIENSSSTPDPANGGAPTSVRATGDDAVQPPQHTTSTTDTTSPATANPQARSQLSPDLIDALLGGPSDAELMKASMAVICSTEESLEDKLVAFDNFEQLVEQIDNANNLGALDLWAPLIGLLESPELDLRRMACWCVGTAVQNNEKAQETALVVGALPRLVRLATGRRADGEMAQEGGGEGNGEVKRGSQVSEEERGLRRKACYAVSSAMRNYQPGAKAVVQALPEGLRGRYEGLDASDMEAVDALMDELRAY